MSKRLLTSTSLLAISAFCLSGSAYSADLLLHKVPNFGQQTNIASDSAASRTANDTAQANRTVAFVSATQTDARHTARAAYVSSGDDQKTATNLTDGTAATVYAFGANDAAPTALVDLGKPSKLQRISTVYTSRGGKVDFYVLPNLPDAGPAPENLRLTDGDARLVGSAVDDGSGRATINFPTTTGRYVMVKWTPSQTSGNLIVGEVAAFGGSDENDATASNKKARKDTAIDDSDGKTSIDDKTVADGKTMIESKDMPGEGPQDTPAEGPDAPPPGLPQPPPFVFIPELLPVSE